MCLSVTVDVPGRSPEELHEIARVCTEAGPLKFDVDRHGWFRHTFNLRLYEPGQGCACSMLADDATWDGPTWSMRPEATSRLAESLSRLSEIVSTSWTFQAAWDPPTIDQPIGRVELLELVRRGEVGTFVKYLVSSAAA